MSVHVFGVLYILYLEAAVTLPPSLLHIHILHYLFLMPCFSIFIHVELPPPAKRRRGLAGSIVSTAVSAALIGTAVGLTVYRM